MKMLLTMILMTLPSWQKKLWASLKLNNKLCITILFCYLKSVKRPLNIIPDGIYVDVTFGGGGHAKAILKELKDGRLIAFDQDSDALKIQLSMTALCWLITTFNS